MNYDESEKNLLELLDKRDTKQILKQSIEEIRLTSTSIWQYIISIILSILVSLLISFSFETVELMSDFVQTINDILLVLLGTVFGSYSIFQALLGKAIVVHLILDKNNILKTSNKTFINLIIIYVFGIVANLVLLLILKRIPVDFLLFPDSIFWSNIIAFIMITMYSILMLVIIFETIVFAINLYRMFCTYNTVTALESLDDLDNLEEKDE